MKDKTRLGINLKIISATSVVLFTLLTVFIGTYAWFQSISNVNHNNDKFKIDNIGCSVNSVEFHKFKSIVTQNNQTYYTFETSEYGRVEIEDDVATYIGSLELGTYSIEEPHNPVLMLLEVTGPETYISATTTSSYITESGTLTEEGNPLSSIVQFHSFTFSSNENDPTSLKSRKNIIANSIALNTNEFIDKDDVEHSIVSNRSKFVSLDNYGEYSGDFENEIVIFNDSTKNSSYVGVVIDYYRESLEYIYSYFLGQDVLSNDITYGCDWEMSL